MAELYSQNSVFLRGAECHCRVAEFLLHKYKIMIKSKFRSSNTLLNCAEYAITRKQHFFPCLNILPGHRNCDVPRSSLSSQISVYTSAKRALCLTSLWDRVTHRRENGHKGNPLSLFLSATRKNPTSLA